MMTEDAKLLREYVENHSDSAFGELVGRHINLVYSTALRMVREPALAEDVVQSVFLQLARKAPAIRDGNALPGWLYRVTHGLAANALRAEFTRRRYETEAMMQAQLEAEAAWEHIGVGLEDAMATLNPADQNLIILRFFQNRSWREVGAALALSEDTVQRRVGRALEKLRTYFVRKGVTVSVSILGAAVATNAVQAAPAGLASTVASASLAQAAAGSPGIWAFLKMLLAKKSVCAGLTAAVAATAVSVPVIVAQAGKREAQALETSLRQGQILHFTFDQDEGNRVTDTSGAENHGQATGATWIPDGHRGGAFQFAPPNQYIRVPNSASLNSSNITLAAWIKTSRYDDTWRRIFDKNYALGYALSVGGAWTSGPDFRGKAVIEIGMQFNKNSGIAWSDKVVTDGQWHHVVTTYNGTEEYLYIDGVPQARIAYWKEIVPTHSCDLTLGLNLSNPSSEYGEVGSSFDGLMDDPMIWNRALSPEEVGFLYKSQQ